MLLELVAIMTAINLILSLWSVRVILLQIKASISTLDQLIGQAISNLIERGLGNIEPINPIQQAIAQMLTNNIKSKTPGEVIEVELPRDDNGRFN